MPPTLKIDPDFGFVSRLFCFLSSHSHSQVILTATFSVFEYVWMGIRVGIARKKYGIQVRYCGLLYLTRASTRRCTPMPRIAVERRRISPPTTAFSAHTRTASKTTRASLFSCSLEALTHLVLPPSVSDLHPSNIFQQCPPFN